MDRGGRSQRRSRRVFCDVGHIRQLSGICQYSAKAHDSFVNQGGTADKAFYSSLTDGISLSRAFLFLTGTEVLR